MCISLTNIFHAILTDASLSQCDPVGCGDFGVASEPGRQEVSIRGPCVSFPASRTRFFSSRNTQDRVFALTVQLRTAATQLQSENQKMKAEMYNIINEVVDITPQFLGDTLRPEWRATMRSDIGIQQLQSDYEELYNRHMTNPHEITPDLYTKMIERYSLLRNSYVSLVRDHAVLKDDLERLIRQLEKPTDVRDMAIGWFSLHSRCRSPDPIPSLSALRYSNCPLQVACIIYFNRTMRRRSSDLTPYVLLIIPLLPNIDIVLGRRSLP